jgi:hypothetical protein
MYLSCKYIWYKIIWNQNGFIPEQTHENGVEQY